MKKIIILCITSILLSACSTEKHQETKKQNPTDEIANTVTETMNNMTLEEKIAQMLIISHPDNIVDAELNTLLSTLKPGGVILFSNNITTYNQTKQFVSAIKNSNDIPLIISVDQEGGRVQRLTSLTDPAALRIPAMYNLGATKNEDLAYDVGRVMAEEMRALGINVVYGPVLDIYSNPNNTIIGNRSFGSDPETVSLMALRLAEGLENNGVIATYKHFPGHGDTATDSHIDLPIIPKTKNELNSLELIPFAKAIEKDAKIIMIGHIALPNLTLDNTPASLSKTIITDLLKNEMGYKGLVITDALNMGALTNNYTEEEIYKMTIESGTDLLLMPANPKEAIELIKKNISEERIDESVRKILTFKYTYLKEDNTLDQTYLGSETHQNIINKIPTTS